MAAHSAKTESVAGKRVTVIGGGTIGASWAALFLANGMKVTISDPQPGINVKARDYIKSVAPSLEGLGYGGADLQAALTENLFFEADLAKAVSKADYVQENGPERLEIKQNLWQETEARARPEALLFSSSSGIPSAQQAMKMRQPHRLLIGHPINPPHLMPLVEIAAQPGTPQEHIDRAFDFYRALGKMPMRIKKEVPGFVTNRLQGALFRECVALAREGVADVRDIDRAMIASLGLRWAVAGPFLSLHLGGGSGGFAHFLEHLAPPLERLWGRQQAEKVAFDAETNKFLLDQIQSAYSSMSITELESRRDRAEISVINMLAKDKSR